METRQRRPHNQLKDAMRKYLTTLDGGHASISEIKAAIEPAPRREVLRARV
jgi:hypothetical protein